MIDWSAVSDVAGGSGVSVGRLLDRMGHGPGAVGWDEVERRLIVEAECWCSAGYAALPRLAELALSGDAEHQHRAVLLAGTIVRSLYRCHEFDGLVRGSAEAVAALHRIAQARPAATGTEHALVAQMQDTLAFAGYTFWATISLDFTDEHYHLDCPHCSTRLAIVIGDWGHYSAIRDDGDGDIHRVPLRHANPHDLTGIGRWMHHTAAAAGASTLADGLTYLFGSADCSTCGSMFNVAEWLEAENSPSQPIDPVSVKSNETFDVKSSVVPRLVG